MLSTHAVSASARIDTPDIQSATFSLTVTNPPPTQMFVGAGASSNGVDEVTVVGTSHNTATGTVRFKAPIAVGSGIHSDTITVVVCTDALCNNQVAGSPATLTATFTVTNVPSVTIDASPATVVALLDEPQPVTLTRTVQVHDALPSEVFLTFSGGGPGVESVAVGADTATGKQFVVTFKPPSQMGIGTFANNITVSACSSPACSTIYAGAPQAVDIDYTVTLPTLPSSGRLSLAHDVVDAAYSAALDAAVMVSTYPQNALYLLDPDTGAEQQLLLNKAPLSLSLSQDGLEVAIGHDALITVVDLTTLGASPTPIILHPTNEVVSLVFDGAGYVHGSGFNGSDGMFHSIAIATDVETIQGNQSTRHPVLQAGTLDIYSPHSGGVGAAKHDFSSGVASFLHTLGTEHCGRMWSSGDGSRMYTACGTVRLTAAAQASDLAYGGALPLTPSVFVSAVFSLSESVVADEIAVIQADRYDCDANGSYDDCVTSVLMFERDFFNRVGAYSLPDITLSGTAYRQHGRFIFHSADGTKRYVISQLYLQPDPAKDFYFTTSP